jgi:hypothetical protein
VLLDVLDLTIIEAVGDRPPASCEVTPEGYALATNIVLYAFAANLLRPSTTVK